MQKFKRKEYKYFFPCELLDPLRQRFLSNMEHDEFCRQREGNRYTVRSIYLDTRHLLFYYEKIDGLKIRKKLRIRTYDLPEANCPAFLEIKRKFNNTIYKERVKTSLSETPLLLNGGIPQIQSNNPQFLDKAVMGKFVYLTKRLKLEPTVLITYEREAFQGEDDARLRVTFDLNVRSYAYPGLDEFYREDDLQRIKDSYFIIEIKFFDRMPIWVRSIVREYRLRVQSISKYCRGLDAWLPTDEGEK